MQHPLRYLIASLAFVTGLHAQQAPSGPPGEDHVSVQFRLLAWGSDIPELNYGRRQKVELTEIGVNSLIHTYTGPALLTFSLSKNGSDSDKPPPVVASVHLSKDTKKVTLLAARTTQDRYGMYVIPDDSAALPPKHARLHNLSADRLLIAYNTAERIELAPGSSVLASAPGTGLVIRVARMVNGRWRELFNNVVQLEDASGINVLLIPGHQGGGLGMFTLPGWPATPANTASSGPVTGASS